VAGERLMLFGPGADSGYLRLFHRGRDGQGEGEPRRFHASEDDNTLVQGVENNKSALGYFGFAYYAAHKDKMTAVKIDGARARSSRASRA